MFQAKTGQALPYTLVVNPAGIEVYRGTLSAADAKAMIDSPTRQQLGKLLQQGNAAVYVLLSGKDEAQNAAATEAAEKLVADVNSGKVKLYSGPESLDFSPKKESTPKEDQPAAEESTPSDADAAAEAGPKKEEPKRDDKPAHSIRLVKLSRPSLEKDDPWLLRSLMAVEGDLAPLADEPMVFLVYGRGRVLPPYIGKGITLENLVEVTEFITGACSCTVKEQNPGVELLMAYDWQAASAAIAEKFGQEEGNQESLTDLFPQLIAPADPQVKTSVSPPTVVNKPPEPADDAGNENSTTDESATTTGTPSANASESPAEPTNTTAVANASTYRETPSVSAAHQSAVDVASDAVPATQSGPSVAITLGIGLAVALVALLAATIFIMNRR
jgi:hypothetical protein